MAGKPVVIQPRMPIGPQGPKGDPAPNVLIQFSPDNANWHDTFQANDIYIRFSVDDGTTWTDGMKFVGLDGADAPEVLIQYSDDGVNWHDTFQSGDAYIRFSADGGSTWSNGAQFIVLDNSDIVDGMVNIKNWFGAQGDGVTDDTAAFLNAMQYCEANNIDLFIPPGNYLITQELPFPNRYSIIGTGYNSNLQLRLSAGQYCFKDADNYRYSFKISGLRFSLDSSGSQDVGAIYVEKVLRGGAVENIWTFDLQRPIYLGDQVYGNMSLRNAFCYLLRNRISDVEAVLLKGNTIMISNLEVIGNFYKGVVMDAVGVCRAFGLNVAGVGSYLMVYGIEILNSSHVSIDTAWVEQLDDGVWSNGLAHAIYVQNSQNVNIRNANIASGSIYSDASEVWVESVSFGQALGGLQVVNNGVIRTTPADWKYQFILGSDGDVIFMDFMQPTNIGLLLNPTLKQGLSTSFLGVTNSALVTAADETADYVTGDRAKKFTVTTSYHGAKITFTNAIPNQPYTIVALVKPISGIDDTYNIQIATLNDTMRFEERPSTLYRLGATDWHLLTFYCKTTTTTLNAKIITKLAGVDPAVFLLDSVNIFEGYNPYDIRNYTKEFARKNKLYYNTTAPTSGTWEVGDIVYNSSPAANGYMGWVCVAAGTPGTWKGFGAIEA